MKLVYRYRVKSLKGLLNAQARKVNFVWNYCNDRQKVALRFNRPWLSGLAKLSEGPGIEAPGFYRAAEQALGRAQRARKRGRVKAIHAKIANKRRDFLHKETRKLVTNFDHAVVGHVNASGLAKTSMAKSVFDVSWSTFRTQLAYKAVKHGAWFQEVSERLTTQICSNCGSLPDSGPKGIADLGRREWRCSDCGTLHDRDLNAAKDILRRGRATLEVGIPSFREGRTSGRIRRHA